MVQFGKPYTDASAVPASHSTGWLQFDARLIWVVYTHTTTKRGIRRDKEIKSFIEELDLIQWFRRHQNVTHRLGQHGLRTCIYASISFLFLMKLNNLMPARSSFLECVYITKAEPRAVFTHLLWILCASHNEKVFHCKQKDNSDTKFCSSLDYKLRQRQWEIKRPMRQLLCIVNAGNNEHLKLTYNIIDVCYSHVNSKSSYKAVLKYVRIFYKCYLTEGDCSRSRVGMFNMCSNKVEFLFPILRDTLCCKRGCQV